MNTGLKTQTKAPTTTYFTPVQNSLLQRKCACGGSPGISGECGDCDNKKLSLQRRADDNSGASNVPPIVHEVLRSPGQELDLGTRTFMEPRFGHDFSNVRVHTDTRAAESARSVNALAFTVGRDIVFGNNQYAPETTTGKETLAHELMHVVQQGNSPTHEVSRISEPGDRYEQEADTMARAVVHQNQQTAPASANEVSAPAQSGGENESDAYDENMLVGGENPTQVSEGGILQRVPDAGTPAAPAAPATPVTLTASTRTPRTSNGCGGYVFASRWGLNGATASTNGFVVQKLEFNLNREICAGGRNDFTKTYWEGWQVRGGQIFVGTSTTPHNADTFQAGPTPDQKGINLEEGHAKYIDGYTAPLSWGTVPEAGSLPATATAPAGWSNSDTIHRSVRVEFDCCNKSDKGSITGDG